MVTAAYIHIPFCEHICHYCDFNKVFLKNQPVDDYIEALLLEMERTLLVRPTEALKTIFIGGGTPTALSAKQLETLLQGMKKILPMEAIEEFTIEVNPDSIGDDKLHVLKTYGVNRLSIGVQTFDHKLLQQLGRTHTRAGVLDAIERSKKFFDNISIDLMFALPNQTPLMFQKTLKEALHLPITHLSAYSLQIEEKTVFYIRHQKERLPLPTEDEEVEMYETLREEMERAGFIQYEISNFAKQGFESKHNLVYWNNEEYYGFGAGAHGYVDGVRYENYRPLKKYIHALFSNEMPILRKHVVSDVERIEEEMFMGLRKREGVCKKRFFEKFGRPIEDVFPLQLDMLTREGLLQVNDKNVQLTDRGLLLGNRVFEQFIGVLEGDF